MRTLHPLAWWGWGICLAIAASRANNFWLLVIVICAAITVTYLRKTDDPWSASLTVGIRIAVVALALRMVIAIIFSVPDQGRILFRLPRIQLPEWLAGIFLGGNVTTSRLHFVFMESLTIFALIVSIAAASSLANPKQTLRTFPGILHEAGVALVIATTLIPNFAASLRRIKQARTLRGDIARFGFKKSLVPLFEEALERALILAESMESRGYGYRTTFRSQAVKKNRSKAVVPSLLLLIGLVSLLYVALLLVSGASYQLFLLVALTFLMLGFSLGNRGNARSKYRPIPWRVNESLVLSTGILAIVVSGLNPNPFVAISLLFLAAAPIFFSSKEKALL